MENSLFGLVKPKLSLYELTREQFFKIFPPETRNISVNGEIVAQLGEEVICDHCNGDVFYHKNDGTLSNAFAISYDDDGCVDAVVCKECADIVIKENGLTKTEVGKS